MGVDLLPGLACRYRGLFDMAAIDSGIIRYAAVQRQSAKPRILQISRTEAGEGSSEELRVILPGGGATGHRWYQIERRLSLSYR